MLNGVTSCLDALSHALCDPGDVIIPPTPVYARMFTDVHDRAGAAVLPLVLRQEVSPDILLQQKEKIALMAVSVKDVFIIKEGNFGFPLVIATISGKFYE